MGSETCWFGEAHECQSILGLSCATEQHSAIYLDQAGEGVARSAERSVHWAVAAVVVRWAVAQSSARSEVAVHWFLAEVGHLWVVVAS